MADGKSSSPKRDARLIDRRDFMNGVAVAVGASLCPVHGALAQGAGPDASPVDPLLESGLTQNDQRYYPPALHGMRGSHPGSFETAHHVRDEKVWHEHEQPQDTGEQYDLLVVGAGISGLSAAYFFRQRKPNARILVLDNHDDFGGHAKRNEFQVGDRLLLGYGGTQSIEAPGRYSDVSKALLKGIGIDAQRFYKYYDQKLFDSLKLAPAIFFDKETFGSDKLIAGPGELPIANIRQFMSSEYINQMPIADAARVDLIRLRDEATDYLADVPTDQKRDALLKMSYRDFLLNRAKAHPDVPKIFQKMPHDLYCVGIDAVSAENCRGMGYPGFKGMALPERRRGGSEEEEPYIFHFPDGNASIARLLVRTLVPAAMPGNSMEDVVTAKANYPALDVPTNSVRIRLNSTVVAAKHIGDPKSAKAVEVTYMRSGKSYVVRGSACVMACYNCMVPYLCPEMPETQKEALAYAVKQPLVYTNVQIRNWTAFKNLGVHNIHSPGGYFSTITLDFPVSMGSYKFPASPDEPCVLHLLRTPCKPGLTAKEQFRAGRWELYSTPFATFEKEIRDQLQRALGAGGFDSDKDIQAITVNRWPHGYAYEYNPLFEPLGRPASERPCVIGRRPFGRIFIANSDADGHAYSNIAIDQGYRAVTEALSLVGASHP